MHTLRSAEVDLRSKRVRFFSVARFRSLNIARALLGTSCVGLACVVMVSGCGNVRGHRARPSTAAGDTVQVTVQGMTIVVPAPEGMVDVMTLAGRGPMAGKHGDVVWGMFQPRERAQQALGSGYHTDVHVMLVVPQENTGSVPANTSAFAALVQSFRDAASRSRSTEGARVSEALGRWRSGARDGDMRLGDPPAGDRFIVAAETPEPDMCQLLTVGRSPASEGGIIDVLCEARMLVRGRILCFDWFRRPATSVGDLAEVSESSSRWAHAVRAANP
jgi:hypothetical protein